MRTCYLHVGMHKTGSSSVQVEFDGFQNDKLAYAPLLTPNHSYALIYMFAPDAAAWFDSLMPGQTPARFWDNRAGLKERFQSFLTSGTRDVLISAEVMTGRMKAESIGNFLEFLDPHFDRIHAIAYIRDPGSYIVSLQQQHLKAEPATFGPERFYPNYRDKIAPWLDQLGKEQVELVLYDRSSLHGGNTISDLASRMGIDPPGSGKTRVNVGLSAEALALTNHWWRRLAEANRSWQERAKLSYARRRAMEYGDKAFGIAPAILDQIVSAHGDDIEWIEQQMGCRFPEHTTKSNEIPFGNDAELVAFAKDTERDFWNWVRTNWRARTDTILAIEAAGRALTGQD